MAANRDVVVVGAGPAGLASALSLRSHGIRPLVIEQADRVGASWRGRYDRLRLNTSRFNSHLPGRPYPKGTPLFPTRDQVVQYLESVAAEDGIDFRFGTRADRIERADGSWSVATSGGPVEARQVVIASGYENAPRVPDWPGRDEFGGELIHASSYRNPVPYAGRRVLVVGSGCTGMEIAYDLAEGGASKVWLAARTPPNIILREGPGGLPGDFIALALLRAPVRFADWLANFGRKMDFGDLTEYGLPIPEEGVFARNKRLGVAPAIVDKDVIEAIKGRRIEVVRGVESLDAESVSLSDGARIEPEAIVCATGYRRALEPLVGHLGVLDEGGRPRATAPRAAAPGLRFVGFTPRPAQFGYAGKEGSRAATAIARELR